MIITQVRVRYVLLPVIKTEQLKSCRPSPERLRHMHGRTVFEIIAIETQSVPLWAQPLNAHTQDPMYCIDMPN